MNGGVHQLDIRRAEALYDSNQLNPAKKILITIIKQAPSEPMALRLLGFIAGRQQDFFSAADYLDRLMKLEPDFIEGWYYLGKSLFEIKRFDDAVKAFDTAILLYPHFFEALHDKGLALLSLHRIDDAIRSFDAARVLNSNSSELWTNLGMAFGKQRKLDQEIACYDNALKLKPHNEIAYTYRGIALCENRQYSEAIEACNNVLLRNPNCGDYVRGYLLLAKLMSADWTGLDQQLSLLKNDVRKEKKSVSPFIFLAISNSPAEQLRVAKKYVNDLYPAANTPLYQGEPYQHERIKIAYLSADFHSHATVFLMLELFKNHDHNRFETIAVSFGPDEESALRTELVESFDRFIDVRDMNDLQVAQLLREMEIDIAVDLKGYTTDCRPGILAYRPAPIQVNYLGYPGTMGADYIDYLVGDKFVIPENEEKFYTESIVVMPDSYQVNGKNRQVDEVLPSRAECGLPEQGFVFCSFNNTYKNNPSTFNVWMNLLKKVDDSVLWLLSRPGVFETNIRAEAASRGVDPERIIFAENQPLPKHLARVTSADLFLDSLPYSAHTTASDALWVNVPVVTCVGSSFAGRVGQSVLHAIDMPELVTESLEEYERLALELATNRDAMLAVRGKLRQKIHETPLFDAERFTRHLESAYEEMWQRHQRGDVPARILIHLRD